MSGIRAPISIRVMGMSERIRELRERRGMSQNDLAKACGVTRQAIQYWERTGGGSPRHAKLEKLASVLGVSVPELVQDGDTHYPGIREEARVLIEELLHLSRQGKLSDSDIYLLRDLVSRLTGSKPQPAYNRRATDRESDWVIGGPDRRTNKKEREQ